MEKIHKLPFVTGTFVTIIVGMISYKVGVGNREIYIRMSISMLVFFVAGVYLKKFIIKINEEIKQKEKEERLKQERELNEKKSLKQEQLKQELYPKEKQHKEDNKSGGKIDLKVKEDEEQQKLYDEEFKPLKVNTVKLNEEIKE